MLPSYWFTQVVAWYSTLCDMVNTWPGMTRTVRSILAEIILPHGVSRATQTYSSRQNNWPVLQSIGGGIVQSNSKDHATWPVSNQSRRTIKFRRGSTILWPCSGLLEYDTSSSVVSKRCSQLLTSAAHSRPRDSSVTRFLTAELFADRFNTRKPKHV